MMPWRVKGASGVSVGLLTVLVLTVNAAAQKPLPKFMGRDVTVSEPPLDDDGFYSKGPASVCVEGPPERQCYTAPQDYGRSPVVRLIQVEKNTSAVFFEVAGGGVSGFPIHFALLRPGFGNQLEDFLLSDDVSNQNQHAFWSASEISPSPIFFTADFVWGVDEAHFSPHRYVILDWSPFLRQTVKTQFSANGELCHGVVTKAVHAGV